MDSQIKYKEKIISWSAGHYNLRECDPSQGRVRHSLFREGRAKEYGFRNRIASSFPHGYWCAWRISPRHEQPSKTLSQTRNSVRVTVNNKKMTEHFVVTLVSMLFSVDVYNQRLVVTFQTVWWNKRAHGTQDFKSHTAVAPPLAHRGTEGPSSAPSQGGQAAASTPTEPLGCHHTIAFHELSLCSIEDLTFTDDSSLFWSDLKLFLSKCSMYLKIMTIL